MWAILERFRELTGVPTVVNTSFNMHGEPIVCSPQDAVRAFVAGRLDRLILGPWWVARRR
jgi:carbamoyltransferase